jgi:phage portal protein BeeE
VDRLLLQRARWEGVFCAARWLHSHRTQDLRFSPNCQALPNANNPAAQFMQMLESDLERTGRFVALQVEDIKLRSRALAARAAAATAQGELDRIEGAPERCALLTNAKKAC